MRTVVALLAVWWGRSGAAGLPTLATTMSEMIPASLVLGGLLLLLDVVESRAPSSWLCWGGDPPRGRRGREADGGDPTASAPV